MRLSLLAALAVILISSGNAEARTHHHRHHQGLQFEAGSVISNPAGCPRIAFCGCGAALRVFGHNVRELWLAANWFKYPRVSPASGMVAVRRHHVMVLEHEASSGRWVVYDPNSGSHLTRIHEVSLSGYVIVNPHA